MIYKEAEQYLLAIPRFTKRKNPLESTSAFLEWAELSKGQGKVIHVAGTNGKGSVCAYLSSVLTKAGYRTGMFTSPHLVTMRERFRIDGRMIGEREFTDILEEIRGALAKWQPDYRATFFEMLFFMAMLWFKRKNTDVILLETGLGGRLDATNSLQKKHLCVITQIGLDHTEYLGNTICKIAWEKAGIMRKNVPVVYASDREEAACTIEKEAEQLSCSCHPVSKNDRKNLLFHKNFIDFSCKTEYYGNVRMHLPTRAFYQMQNSMLALRALDVLHDVLPVAKEELEEGIREAFWEGRMEEIAPCIILDGAHNIEGIRAFLDTVRMDGCKGRRLLLFSVVQDKQWKEMIKLLADANLFSAVYLAGLTDMRGLSCEKMREAFVQAGMEQVKCAGSVRDAFRAAEENTGREDMLYIAGSLYLAGEIKRVIGRNQNDKF